MESWWSEFTTWLNTPLSAPAGAAAPGPPTLFDLLTPQGASDAIVSSAGNSTGDDPTIDSVVQMYSDAASNAVSSAQSWFSSAEPWVIGLGVLVGLFLILSLVNALREV